MQTTVSAVIVNYNGEAAIGPFLDSLQTSTYPVHETIVVDNASSDRSLELLRARGDRGLTVVASGDNLGFGRGCNLGVARATGELLLLANPDVRLEPETIGTLVADLATRPDAAVICPTLIEGFYRDHPREARLEDVAALAFAVALVRHTDFRAIGGFDPAIFMYWEDTDFCYRMWLAGRHVLKDWNAVANHALHGSGGGAHMAAQQIRNGLYVHLKARSWPSVARFAGRMAIKTVVRGIRLRDPAVLAAWPSVAGDLRSTLDRRRAELGRAADEDRERLWRLCREHDYWRRRSYWAEMRHAMRRR